MTKLLTSAQMRAVEKAAIASGEVTGLDLMERAGQGVVQAIFAEWPELDRAGGRAVVLCGPGNNGGDGFVVARLLAEKGWTVAVFLYGDPNKLPPDARVNYERWYEMGAVEPLSLSNVMAARPFGLLIDAVFGIGLTRPMSGQIAEMFDYIEEDLAQFANRSVAIDIASGLCAESGRWLGPVWEPALTVTFHAKKPGHILSEGGRITSAHALRVVEIGLPNKHSNLGLPGVALTGTWVAHRIGKDGQHKFSHGHALVLSGGVGQGGAARLAARGALRIGAGVVTLGCPPAAILENAMALDAVMTRKVPDAAALDAILADLRITALCLGPGLGLSDQKRDLIKSALASDRATVLDADALTLLSQNSDLFGLLHDRCVLTPHGGEFARLFPDIAAELAEPATTGPAYSKVDATRDAAKRAGCVVLFKGADTVIAHPDGRCAINASAYDRAAPWLATAGSGDVLAGFITGLLARGFAPQQAAKTGAWLHTEAARSFGPGLIAEDLPEALPKVFRALGL